MQTNKVEICGVNTSRLTLLSESEKMRLLRLARTGDRSARDSLVSGNIRLVLSVIQRFIGRGESSDDLFQVGCIGLIKAIDNFDTELGVRFSTYAVPMIIGEIRRYLRDNNSLRVSRSLRDLAYRAMQAREALQRRNSLEPSISDIAAELGAETAGVVLALESVASPLSLHDPIYSDGDDNMCVMDQLGEDNCEHNWICEMELRRAISRLSDRERQILFLRYIEGRTQVEVAGKIGISQAQVSRLEKVAVEKVKGSL